jgi:quercetin dioxygenase-like cupin family protein
VNKSNKATIQRPLGGHIIDAQMVTADLAFFIKQLQSEKAWKKSDRNSITIFKSIGISMVLIALHKGAEMADHTAEGMMSILILKGKCKFNTNEESVKLQKGNLLKLSGGIPHSLRARKKTIFLLTIVTAGHNQVNQMGNTALSQEKLNGMSVIRETV